MTTATSAHGTADNRPEMFEAYIGGFFGTSYAVALKGDTLIYKTREAGGNEQEQRFKPTAAQWRAFAKALASAGAQHWQSRYNNSDVMDGTQWSLKLKFGELQVNSSGSNNYPDRLGKANDKPEYTPTFEAYLKAVKALLGGREFR